MSVPWVQKSRHQVIVTLSLLVSASRWDLITVQGSSSPCRLLGYVFSVWGRPALVSSAFSLSGLRTGSGNTSPVCYVFTRLSLHSWHKTSLVHSWVLDRTSLTSKWGGRRSPYKLVKKKRGRTFHCLPGRSWDPVALENISGRVAYLLLKHSPRCLLPTMPFCDSQVQLHSQNLLQTKQHLCLWQKKKKNKKHILKLYVA